ncbi:protein NDRG3-like isoform X2 [Amphiura filiformis]|uniref:protein NDRG3-like isoform X2 n=1 Tax=Amphiura filiformis TaxID=82378 RepID=UPI003B224EDB
MASYRKLDIDDSNAGGEVILQTKTLEAQVKDAGATHLNSDDMLMGISVTDTKPRDFDGFEESKAPLLNKGDTPSYEIEYVHTDFGTILVAVQGDKKKPAIITMHDIGLNHVSCFQGFFNFSDMQPILHNFCVYHVNAPGQEQGAAQLPEGFQYPEMEALSEIFTNVVEHFALKKFIGFGMGAGANLLARYELNHHEYVEGLVLVNCVSTQSTWTEWAQQKLSNFYLRGRGMTSYTQEYLLWHYFGRETMETNHDLVTVFREYLAKSVNPFNLSLFINSYIRRSDMRINRELDPTKLKNTRTLKCDVMLIGGGSSPHIDDTVEMNGRLNPANSTWIKMSDCGGMILEEQPAKLCESFRLFLQGMGYVLRLRMSKPAPAVEPVNVPPPKYTAEPSPVMV